MSERSITRRRFLTTTGLLAGAAGLAILTGCQEQGTNQPAVKAPVVRPAEAPVTKPAATRVPDEFDTAMKKDLTPKNLPIGIFRAATLTFYEGLFGFVGHGSLIQHVDGNLYIATVAHVADSLKSEDSTVHIPGVGTRFVSRATFEYHGDQNDTEAAAFHPLRAQTINAIHELQNKGEFTPLRAAPRWGKKGDLCAVARTDLGLYMNFKLMEHVPHEDTYLFSGQENNVVCAGQSGSAILLKNQYGPSAEFIGMLSKRTRTETEKRDPHGLYPRCVNNFLARSNNYLGSPYRH